MIQAILGALMALPKLVEAFDRLTTSIEKHMAMQFMQDASKTKKMIENAQTQEEFREASKALHDLISKS